ncbi:MAG TPA: metallophosphoesterase family protein [Dehalococcoidia bacterium]
MRPDLSRYTCTKYMRITGIIARTDHTGTTDGTMRAAIVSDVHSNLAALEAVLAHAESLNALDQVWALGDLVGYGPQPSECLAMLRQYDFRSVAGNHDLAVVGVIDTSDFNPAAATANHWTADRIGDLEREYLRTLPKNLTIDGISLVHGSLRDPVWEYMYSIDAAVAQFANMKTRFSLCRPHACAARLRRSKGRPGSRLPADRERRDNRARRPPADLKSGRRRTAARWGRALRLRRFRQQRAHLCVLPGSVRHRTNAGTYGRCQTARETHQQT